MVSLNPFISKKGPYQVVGKRGFEPRVTPFIEQFSGYYGEDTGKQYCRKNIDGEPLESISGLGMYVDLKNLIISY